MEWSFYFTAHAIRDHAFYKINIIHNIFTQYRFSNMSSTESLPLKIKAQQYCVKITRDPVRPYYDTTIKEIFIPSPYNLCINYTSNSTVSNDVWNIFTCEKARANDISTIKEIELDNEWVENCARIQKLKIEIEQLEQKLATRDINLSVKYSWSGCWEYLNKLEKVVPWQQHFPGSPAVTTVFNYIKTHFCNLSSEQKTEYQDVFTMLQDQIIFNIKYEYENFESLR